MYIRKNKCWKCKKDIDCEWNLKKFKKENVITVRPMHRDQVQSYSDLVQPIAT